jgi:RNA polymerase sigma factor (sigma-70 family)
MSTHADSRHRCTVADLLLAARRGDRSAWEQLIDRYSRLIRSVAAEFRLQESDAADVAQNTWLRLFAHAATIRDPEKLGGWLATTARREALTLIRKSRPEVATESAGDDIATPDPSPEDVVVLAETRAAVRRAAAELTGRQRLLVDELFYQPPRSYDEVSRRTGLPVGSIGPTRIRTLRRLHRSLHSAEYGAEYGTARAS